MPPATKTTSFPSAAATGQFVPNGPRMPMESPFFSSSIPFVTAPTARVVWTSACGTPGSPLMEIGTSPMPQT